MLTYHSPTVVFSKLAAALKTLERIVVLTSQAHKLNGCKK